MGCSFPCELHRATTLEAGGRGLGPTLQGKKKICFCLTPGEGEAGAFSESGKIRHRQIWGEGLRGGGEISKETRLKAILPAGRSLAARRLQRLIGEMLGLAGK